MEYPTENQTVCLDRVAGMLRDPGKVATHFAHSIRGYSPAKQCVWIEWPGCFAIPAKSQRTLPIQSGDTPRPNSVFGSSGRDASRSRQSRNALCPFNPGILPGQTVCLDQVAGMLRDPGKVATHFAHSIRGYSPAKQCVWIEWPGCFAIPAKSQRTLPILSSTCTGTTNGCNI